MPNPRKPTALKVLEGTYQPCRAPKNEPKPKTEAVAPKWLSAEARQEWKRLSPELERLGLLTGADRATFSAYCEAWAQFREACKEIQRDGQVIESRNGHKMPHPAVSIRHSAIDKILKLSAGFGLTPADRTRIEAAMVEEESDDLLD